MLAKTLIVEPNGKATLVGQSVLAAVQTVPIRAGVFLDLNEIGRAVADYARDGERFALVDLARMAGVEYGIASMWVREWRLMKPMEAARGRRAGVYARPELFVAAVAGDLYRAGYSPDAMRRAMPTVREWLRDLWAEMARQKQAERRREIAAAN